MTMRARSLTTSLEKTRAAKFRTSSPAQMRSSRPAKRARRMTSLRVNHFDREKQKQETKTRAKDVGKNCRIRNLRTNQASRNTGVRAATSSPKQTLARDLLSTKLPTSVRLRIGHREEEVGEGRSRRILQGIKSLTPLSRDKKESTKGNST